MDSMWVWVGVIVLVAIVLGVATGVKGGDKAPEKQKPKYIYTAKKHIMTSAEEKFFRTLCEIFEHKCYVIPQVHLSALFSHKVKGQDWRAAFRHINGKSVDFVLCRRSDLSPLCAVELDDRTHDMEERRERDVEVERIFESANIPLVRFRGVRDLTRQEIVDRFSKTISTS